MPVRFRGGQLDGEEHPISSEELWADWDPQKKRYVVSNEDGDIRGEIQQHSAKIEISVDPEMQKLIERRRRFIMAIVSISLLLYLGGAFLSNDLHLAVLNIAYSMLLVTLVLLRR